MILHFFHPGLSTIGLINFEDKKFRRFHGYFLNHEIKYPHNFLYTLTDKGQLQHTILFKNKSHSTEMVQDTCPTIVSFSIIAIAKLS